MRTIKTPQSTYLNLVFPGKETAVLKKIRKTAEAHGVSYMQVSSYEGRMLQFLCRIAKVKKAIEIGTLYGYSSLMIAQALPKNGKLFTLDIDAKRQSVAQKLIKKDPHHKKIHFIAGNAIDSLNTLKTKAPFDMVFIDADKANYLKYLHWCNTYLKKEGLVVADNTFLFGALFGKKTKQTNSKALKVMKLFNKEIASHYTSTLIPTQEGLTVGMKK